MPLPVDNEHMKVLDLRCNNGHRFEGWFASDEAFMEQNGRGLVECPLCAERVVTRMPSAPRLNLAGPRESDAAQPATAKTELTAQQAWMHMVRHVLANTDDVGDQFAEVARRIHYGEIAARGIRGQASADERSALQEEGIETMALPLPAALKGTLQ